MLTKPLPLRPAPRAWLSVEIGRWVQIEARGWAVAVVPAVVLMLALLYWVSTAR